MNRRLVGLAVVAGVLAAGAGEALARKAGRDRGREADRGSRSELPPNIAEDLTLEAGKTYYLTKNVTVQKEATLTIEPRARILCDEGTSLEVFGAIVAAGESFKATVTFEPAGRGIWKGVLISNRSGKPSKLTWCTFRRAEVAVRINDGVVSLTSCRFEDNDVGLQNGTAQSKPSDSQVTLTDCVFEKNRHAAIHIANQSPKLQSCTITNNKGTGLLIGFGGHVQMTLCTISKNTLAGVQAGEIREAGRGRRPEEGAALPETGEIRVTATRCNIFMNGRYDVYNGSKGNWVFTDCYWGDKSRKYLKDEQGNLPTVMDRQDNEAFGAVQVRPYQEAPIKEAGADEFGRRRTGAEPTAGDEGKAATKPSPAASKSKTAAPAAKPEPDEEGAEEDD